MTSQLLREVLSNSDFRPLQLGYFPLWVNPMLGHIANAHQRRCFSNVKNSYPFTLLVCVALAMLATQSIAEDLTRQAIPEDAQSQSADSLNAVINNRSITSRVLGGGDADVGQWPSMVLLARDGAAPLGDRLFCGGTLVAERWVMTAAHCAFNTFDARLTPGEIRVVAGVTDLANDVPEQETVVVNVIVHEDFDIGGGAVPPHDIALLELANATVASPTELFAEESEDYTGTMAFVVGWGAVQYISNFNATYPNKLQDASLPLTSLAKCNDPLSYNGLVQANQLCAGFVEGGVDACAGDSGGPLFILRDGVPVQIGITSYGNGCAEPLFYGIYTNVSHFIPWLSQYIAVPDQDPALVNLRQGGGSVPAEKSSRGEINWLLNALLLLMLAARIRKTAKSSSSQIQS